MPADAGKTHIRWKKPTAGADADRATTGGCPYNHCRRHPWFLKLDIRKYFDSIDHAIAMDLLARCFKERPLPDLFGKIIDTYHTAPGRGVPIGNLISQHLANFYLGPLDRRIKEVRRIRGYLRYMDDFILFAPEKESLQTELDEIRAFLKSRLALTLKDNIQLNRTR